MENQIRAGKLNYLNAIIFYMEMESALNDIKYVDGTPAVLNRLLRKGEIDISPSSSIEFAFSPRTYLVLPDLSISSYGEVKSVLLFSKHSLTGLNLKKIAISSASATSFALLRIILGKFISIKVEYQHTTAHPEDAIRTFDALLLIGDEALNFSKKWRNNFVYDMGKLWQELTGLPFVFALWIIRRDSFARHREKIKKIHEVLLKAKERFAKERESYLKDLPHLKYMDREFILDYWNTINYDLNEEHLRSINKFYELSAELNILPKAPLLAIADV